MPTRLPIFPKFLQGDELVTLAGLDLDRTHSRLHCRVGERTQDEEVDLHALGCVIRGLRIEVELVARRDELLGDDNLREHSFFHRIALSRLPRGFRP